MASQMFAIRVDDENNADAWWTALRERNGSFADRIARGSVAVVTEEVLEELMALPGFDGGPEYAPHPITWASEHQDEWATMVGEPHTVETSL